jgi:hypothetical protein
VRRTYVRQHPALSHGGGLDGRRDALGRHGARRITGEPGFVDYEAIDTGDGTITSVTIFDDEDQCLRSNDLAAEFLRDHLAAFELERIDVFGSDVMVGRAADKVLQPAHH